MKNYGQILKDCRILKGKTLTEIEKETGINNSNLSRWECGKVTPSIMFYEILADYFGCTIDYLVGREDELGNISVAGEELNENERNLVALFRSMPEARQRTVLDMMQAMSDGSGRNIKKTLA